MDFTPAAEGGTTARCPMHGADFAAAPHDVYDRLRAAGPAGPVELAPGVEATLVVGHEAALRVLQNDALFARDSRRWSALREGRVAMDSPVVPMMMFRPNCLFTDGAEHLRLRKAVTDSLDAIDVRQLARDVRRMADFLIDRFSERGRADLIDEYAKVLPLLVFNKMFGCSADIGDRLTRSMAALFEGRDALRADQELTECLMELVALKRREPGDDLTSRLVRHPAGLTDTELKDQLVMLMGAGVEPERNLIANTVLLMLSPEGTGLLIEEAMEHVLWDNPPIANYATHFPKQDVDLAGTRLPAGSPVVISFAGANADPSLRQARRSRSQGAHLSWGAGPHKCPASSPAQVIALTAVEKLFNELDDLALELPAERLTWRQGPFHRALASLPVRFAPSPAGRVATATGRHPLPPAARAQAPAAGAEAAERAAGPARKKGFWGTFLDVFRL
jgi:cytochrome P450